MRRLAFLLQTPTVALGASDLPPAAAHDAIGFVESGAFDVRPVGHGVYSVAQGMLLVKPRGVAFACRHHDAPPVGRSLSVEYSADAIDALRVAGLPELRLAGMHPTPRQRFLRRRLRTLAVDPGDTMGTLRLELLAAALFESVVCPRLASERHPPPVSPDVMRRIARAAELIEAESARPHRLADLALVAGMSPYHFVRSFGSLVGVPPHRYLVAVRLRDAVRRMDQGASVTAACYAVGFSSPSHFARAFRQHFGIRPSALARERCSPLVRAALHASPWGRRAARERFPLPAAALGA